MADKNPIVYPDFKKLIIPLHTKEYQQLENDIKKHGCKKPLLTWHGIIVDGHKRYDICTRLNIQYSTEEISFDSKEAVISWICASQLKRKDISFEARKFLIGMEYEAEKIISGRRTAKEIASQEKSRGRPPHTSRVEHTTAKKIGDRNYVSHTTVQKYAAFTRALEEIGKKEPSLVPKLLSGEYKLSHNQILGIAQMSVEEVKKFNRRIEIDPTPYLYYKYMRSDRPAEKDEAGNEPIKNNAPSVKDMPQYDPDAEINSLTLTIPSWKSSIERTKSHADLNAISPEARKRVLQALFDLRTAVSDMMITIQEEKWKT